MLDYLFFAPFFFGGDCVFISVYRACYGVLRFVMESGAKGCEVRF